MLFSNGNDVSFLGQIAAMQSIKFPQQPFDAIAHNSIAYLAGNSHASARS